MSFTFACWNVKRFNYTPQRARAVSALIAGHDPDVIGILEFLAKDAARRLVRSDKFSDYDFAFTDSDQGIEILVGWRRSKFAQVLFTQRREMQVGNNRLRPGGLLSVREKSADVFHNLLFLHTDSGTDAVAYKNRQTMFGKIWSLQRALAKLPEAQGQARLIALGDLNTMGRKGSPNAKTEITGLTAAATQNGMALLPKSHEKTWRNIGGTMSNLDHVVASQELQFAAASGLPGALITVDGWVNRTGEARQNFVKNISVHSLLFGTVL
ncbi:MAG: Endo/exonuclease/phosphatase protein [Verrucomicrobiota bacterium]|nr:Endo/exonuclease/phosphatase protein [Verrucomicrobiota bacterium]